MTKLTLKFRLKVEGTRVLFQILEQSEILRRRHFTAPWLNRPGDDYLTLSVSSLYYPELLAGEVYLRGTVRGRDDDTVELNFGNEDGAQAYADKVRATLRSFIASGGFQVAEPITEETDGDVTTLTLI